MKKQILAIAMVVLSFSALAAARTNTVKNATADWTSPANFEDSSWLPGDGDDDVVIVPKDATVYVSDGNAASLAQFLKLKRLIPASETSRIEMTVSGAEPVTVPFPISAVDFSSDAKRVLFGPLVKKGAGTLVLSSTSLQLPEWEGASTVASFDYYMAVEVQQGTLSLPQSMGCLSYFGRLAVNDGATLQLPKMSGTAKTVTVYGLTGGGSVTCPEGTKYSLAFNGKRAVLGATADFSGSISGTYGEMVASGDAQVLSGEASSAVFTQVSINGGELGASWLGDRYADSSVGHCDWSQAVWMGGGKARFVHVGAKTTEGVSRYFVMNHWGSPYASIIDGGAVGGYTFVNSVQRFASATVGMRLVLAGDGGAVNSFASTVTDSIAGGHGLYLTKEGSGTWNLGTTDRDGFTGGVSVDEGVLQYGTIADRGVACSLGTAANLTDGTTGASDQEHRVNYAIRLGGTTTAGERKDSGRLEYVGTDSILVTNREIAVAGQGGLRANGSARQRYCGVYGISADPMTLYLDGDGTNSNEVHDVSDGQGGGMLSVVKDGNGTWVLAGEQSWHGDLSVKGGELIVRNPTHYSWYEWTITAMGPKSTSDQLQVCEFDLCDADSRIVSKGLKKAADAKAMNPGEAAVLTSRTLFDNSLDKLFDDVHYGTFYYATIKTADDTAEDRMRQEDPTSWLTVRMRLDPAAGAVTSYDYCNYKGTVTSTAPQNCPSNYFIRASLDGIHWDLLKTVENAPIGYQWAVWSIADKAAADNTGVHSGGAALASAPVTLPSVLQNVRSVSVSNGGRLTLEKGCAPVTIGRLKLDAASGGTISGFTFAESGVLEVENHASGGVETLPADFADVSGLENLANWQVSFDGKMSRYAVTVKNGKLTLVQPGMAIIIR